jgi:hypothetical protein
MKKILILLIVLSFVSIAQAEPLDFDFDGPGGPYRSTELVELLRIRLGFVFSSMTVVLVETPTIDNADYKKQIKALDSIDDAKLEGIHLMYVTSCTSKVPKDGYRTSIEDAKDLAGDNIKFRVRLLDGNGNVYHTSGDPVSSDDIVKLVQKNQKANK